MSTTPRSQLDTTAAELESSYRYCHALTRRTAKNFYYSFLTLPTDRFRAMCVLYAFMRITDDLGDSGQPAEERAQLLAEWRGQLVRSLEPETGASLTRSVAPPHPAIPAVADLIATYKIPVEHLLAVISGVEMDLGEVALETFDQLQRYCYHVAGAVGLACIHVWGFHDDRALTAAIDCGTALQLTNILRDLREDATLGRVYIPREDLERFGCTAADLASGLPNERFTRLMQFETDRAREYYARAAVLFDYLDPPGKPILDTMLRIYGGLLDEIERRQFDVFSRRVSLSRSRKLMIAAGAVMRHKVRTWFGGR